jgi:DNA-directed RNA polymerase subunit RPC12/RpoP
MDVSYNWAVRHFGFQGKGPARLHMSTQNLEPIVHCPDCGGIVGATTTTEHGPPCRCFESKIISKPKRPMVETRAPEAATDARASGGQASARMSNGAAQESAAEVTLDDAESNSSSERTDDSDLTGATESPAQAVEKLCISCGKNVAGHRRVKDSRGYMCLNCAKAEEARNKVQGAECPKCHRIVKEDSIATLDGDRLCQRCLREARELRKPGSKRFRKIDGQHFEQAGKKQVITLAIIAGVLVVFMLIGWLMK